MAMNLGRRGRAKSRAKGMSAQDRSGDGVQGIRTRAGYARLGARALRRAKQRSAFDHGLQYGSAIAKGGGSEN
jgi:hypothetical protein